MASSLLRNDSQEHRLHLNVKENSVLFQYTSTSWMMWNWMLSALASACKIILYDGAAIPPGDPLRLLRIVDEEGATHFGTSPSYLSAIQRLRCTPRQDLGCESLSKLVVVMVTGSPSSVANFEYVSRSFGAHTAYISISGGTDICGCFCIGCYGWLPIIAPRLGAAGLGLDVRCLGTDGEPRLGIEGELCCCGPAPIFPLNFVDDKENKKYREAYFSQFQDSIWCHGDCAVQFCRSDGGGFLITGR